MTALAVLLSFLLGLLVGIALRDALDLLRSREGRGMTLPRWMNSPRLVPASLAFALIANVAVVVTFLVTHSSQSSYQACEAQYQQDFALSYQARYRAAKAVSHAMDGVVKAVADQSPAEFKAALNNYQSLRADQQATWAKNPLPPLPSKVCGPAKDAS